MIYYISDDFFNLLLHYNDQFIKYIQRCLSACPCLDVPLYFESRLRHLFLLLLVKNIQRHNAQIITRHNNGLSCS